MNEPETYKTKSGRILSDRDLAELAEEAERGYDPKRITPHLGHLLRNPQAFYCKPNADGYGDDEYYYGVPDKPDWFIRVSRFGRIQPSLVERPESDREGWINGGDHDPLLLLHAYRIIGAWQTEVTELKRSINTLLKNYSSEVRKNGELRNEIDRCQGHATLHQDALVDAGKLARIRAILAE